MMMNLRSKGWWWLQRCWIHENRVTAIISSKPQNAEDGDNAFTELTRWPSLKTDQFVSSFWSDKGVTTTTQKEVRHDHSVTYNISTWGKFSWWKQPLHSQIRNPISTMVPSEHLWSQGYYSSHTCACIISIGHALQVGFFVQLDTLTLRCLPDALAS